jgi:RHS repeat-associated protein
MQVSNRKSRRFNASWMVLALVAGVLVAEAVPHRVEAADGDGDVIISGMLSPSLGDGEAATRHAADVALGTSAVAPSSLDDVYRGPVLAGGDPRMLGVELAARDNAVAVEAPEAVGTLGDPVAPLGREVTGFDDQRSVELTGERSAHQVVFRNPDGSRTVKLSTLPVNYLASDDSWQPIDSTVSRGADGVLRSGANAWRAAFEVMVPGKGVGLVGDGSEIQFWAVDVAPVEPTLEPDGRSVRYSDVSPGVDLLYHVSAAGVEEHVVIKAADSRTSVAFVVEGVELTADGRGLAGEGVGLAGQIKVSGVESTLATGVGVGDTDQVFNVETGYGGDPGQTLIEVGLDAGFVQELPKDAFPVVVDPSVTLAQSWAHDYNRKPGSSSGSYCGFLNSTRIRFGNPGYASPDQNCAWRGVLNMNYSGHNGANVSDVSLSIAQYSGQSPQSGTENVWVWWAATDEYHAPYTSTVPRYYTSAGSVANNEYTNWDGSDPFVFTAPSWSSSFSPGVAALATATIGNHGTAQGTVTWSGGAASKLRDLFNVWLRTGVAGQTLLFTGNEPSSGYTMKMVDVTLSLTYNRDPAAATLVANSASLSAPSVNAAGTFTDGGIIGWSVNAASDPDGDQVRYRHWVVNTGTGYRVCVPSSACNGSYSFADWTTSTSPLMALPASWAGATLKFGTDVWDDFCQAGTSPGECHVVRSRFSTTPQGNVAFAASPSSSAVATNQPGLSVAASGDADGDTVQYRFQACPQNNDWANPNCASSAWGSSLNYVVPNQIFKWNVPNYWRVQKRDGKITIDTLNQWVRVQPTPVSEPAVGFGAGWAAKPVADVNTSTGNFSSSSTDVSVPGVFGDVSVTRTYNSKNTAVGAFGRGWSFNGGISAIVDGATIEVTRADGSLDVFGQQPDGTFASAYASAASLTVTGLPVGVARRMTSRDGVRWDYDTAGKFLKATDLYGREYTSTWPNVDTQVLTDVASGRTLTLAYQQPAGATGKRVVSVTTQPVGTAGPLVWRYYYAGDQLIQVCDPRDNTQGTGKCVTYGYDAWNRLNSIVLPRGNTLAGLTYDSNGRVASRTDGMGKTWTFAYTTASIQQDGGFASEPVTRTTVTAPDGDVDVFDSGWLNETRRVEDVNMNQGATHLSLETWTNRTLQGWASDVTADTSAAASCVNGVTCAITDLDFSASTHGTTPLADTSSIGVPNRVVDADGLITAYQYGAGGAVTKEIRADGTIATATVDVAGSPTVVNDPAIGSTQYVYTTAGSDPAVGDPAAFAPVGLLKSETSPAGLLTTHGYDEFGNLRITETVAVAPLNRSEYTYDSLGRMLTSTRRWAWASGAFQQSATTSYAYDEIGNLTEQTDPAIQNPVTLVTHRLRATAVYDANANMTVQTRADLTGGDPARVTVATYDANDRPITVTDPEGGVTTTEYNDRGLVSASIDPIGRRTEFDYDDEGRLSATILKAVTNPNFPSTGPRDVTLSVTEYDSFGNYGVTTDAMGTRTRTEYTDAGAPATVTVENYQNGAAGAPPQTVAPFVTTQATYADGRVSEMLTGNASRHVQYLYDSTGRVTEERLTNTVADPALTSANRKTAYGYDAFGRPVSTALCAVNTTWNCVGVSSVTSTTYDVAGNVTSTTIENGAADITTSYAYDGLGRRVSITDPDGHTTNEHYDLAGRVWKTEQPSVSIETWNATATTARPTTLTGYSTFGEPTHVSDPSGQVTTTTYDRNGRPTLVAYPAYTQPHSGGVTLNPTEQNTYDAASQKVTWVDRRGQTTTYQYDTFGNQVRITDPPATSGGIAGVTQRSFDDVGRLYYTYNQTSNITEAYSYDRLGRIRTQREPGGGWTTLDYNGQGHPIYEMNSVGALTTRVYSPAGELLRETDPLGEANIQTYDAAGRTLVATDPLGRTNHSIYDQAGRLTGSARWATGGPVTATACPTAPVNPLCVWHEGYSYDASGNRTAIWRSDGTDPVLDVATSYVYDSGNRLTQVTQPINASAAITTSYGYDSRGNHTKSVDGNGQTWWTGYNSWGLEERRVEPVTAAHPALSDRSFVTSYDAAGAVIIEEQPGGVVVTRTRDLLGRELTVSGGASGGMRSFGWDRAGRMVSASGAFSSLSMTYTNGLLTGMSGGGGATFGYDSVGRLVSRSDGVGLSTYSWTLRDELSLLSDPLTGKTRRYSWNDAGELAGIDYDFVAPVDVPSAVRSFTYDGAGRLSGDVLTDASSLVQRSVLYGYDMNGNVSTETVAGGVVGAGTFAYGYDWVDRLTSWSGPGVGGVSVAVIYGWDGNGNRVSDAGGVSVFDERNRVVSNSAGSVWEWSPRGTLVSSMVGGVTTGYSFDGLGRMTGVGGVTYGYDSLDRVGLRDGVSVFYSGLSDRAIQDHVGRLTALSPDGSAVAVSSGGVASVVVADRHGDVTAAVSSGGGIVGSWAFDPFGVVTEQSGTSLGVGFQAHMVDPVSGLVNMGARWYQPYTASFTARDSYAGAVATPATMHRYSYAIGNPLRYWDPDGHSPQCLYIDGRCVRKGANYGGYTYAAVTASKQTLPVTPKKKPTTKRPATPKPTPSDASPAVNQVSDARVGLSVVMADWPLTVVPIAGCGIAVKLSVRCDLDPYYTQKGWSDWYHSKGLTDEPGRWDPGFPNMEHMHDGALSAGLDNPYPYCGDPTGRCWESQLSEFTDASFRTFVFDYRCSGWSCVVEVAAAATTVAAPAIRGAAKTSAAIRASRAPRVVSRFDDTATKADDLFQVSGAGANRAGTLVPESFDLSVAGQKFSVHPNATKHMAEYATSTGAGSVPMSSFAGSVETAVAQGLKPGRNFVQVGPWELGIDTNGNVIYHAVYRPGG